MALGLALGLIAIVTLPGVLGYQSLTVVSGSMEPTLGVGSVVIDEVISPLDARPGDIVTFKDPLRPRQLTHRLQRMRVEGDTAYMVTLGDANDAPEHWTVQADGHIGRVVAHLPKLGYVRAALGTRYARLGVLGAVMAFGAFLLVDLWRPRRSE
jgi:signal peptidase